VAGGIHGVVSSTSSSAISVDVPVAVSNVDGAQDAVFYRWHAARTGVSLRDLMARMGHDSPDAALIYQHATRQADKAIADAVSAQVEAEQSMKTRKTRTTRRTTNNGEGRQG
jgi:hypothetical protein